MLQGGEKISNPRGGAKTTGTKYTGKWGSEKLIKPDSEKGGGSRVT